MKTSHKIIVGLGALVILGLIANDMFIVQPKREKEEKLASLKFEKKICEDRALLSYLSDWNGECESRKLGENCSLPKYNADRLDEIMQKDKERCFDNYKLETSLIK